MRATQATCTCGPACSCKNCRCGPTALFFDTLGNTTRLLIIETLRTQPHSVTEIVAKTGIEQTLASHNLKRLEQCGFVTSKTKGKNRIYALNKKSIEPLMKLVHNHVKRYCARHAKPCACGKHRSKKEE